MKSGAVNSYGMFHPSGPYFLRSKMSAWKKANPKNSFFHWRGLLQSSKDFLSWVEKLLIKLFLRPRGGSYVILTPLIRMVGGNISEGMEVSHILKSRFTFSGFSAFCSMILSKLGMNEGAKWQFWRSTHLPSCIACLIPASANSAWPWPSEIWGNPAIPF